MASVWFHALLVLTVLCFVDATEGGSRANLRRHRATRTDRLSVDVVNATVEVEDSDVSDGDSDASEGTISNSTDFKEQSDFDSVTKALKAEEEEVETDDDVGTATEVQSEAKEIQDEDAEIEAQVAVDSKKNKDPLVNTAVAAARHVHSALRAESAQKKAHKAKNEAGAKRAATAKHQKREHKAHNKKTTKAAVADAKVQAVNVGKTSVKKQTASERHSAKVTVSQSDDEDEDVQAEASDDESEQKQDTSDSDSDSRSESSSEDDSDQESSAVAMDEEDTPW